jgi:AcrR family transcriptional regulator
MPPVKAPPKRLTRQEQRERTRERLIDTAAEVFAERGFHGAAVEEIAERAGYTRGAFYSNFEGKDDLFLAVYDKRMEKRVGEVSTMMRESGAPVDFFATLRESRVEDPANLEWLNLQSEFLLYALRNPEVRPKFAERFRRVRRLYAHAIEEVFAAMGLAVPGPVEDLAIILQIVDEGSLPLHQLDPDEIRRDFFFDALTMLFEAGVALSEKRASS